MRHTFKFPSDIQDAVRQHVRSAVSKIDHNRYQQEANYIAALAISLDGVVYQGELGLVEFRATVANDRGPASSEKWSGIDFVITASISDINKSIRKAIVFQAKRGDVNTLNRGEVNRLRSQIGIMKKYTASPKVLETPVGTDKFSPTIISGNNVFSERPYKQYSLEDYFVQRVLTTLDGNTDHEYVDALQESSFTQLRILASIINE